MAAVFSVRHHRDGCDSGGDGDVDDGSGSAVEGVLRRSAPTRVRGILADADPAVVTAADFKHHVGLELRPHSAMEHVGGINLHVGRIDLSASVAGLRKAPPRKQSQSAWFGREVPVPVSVPVIAALQTAVDEHPTVVRTPLAKLVEYPADPVHVAGLLADTVGVNPAGKDAFGWTASGNFVLIWLQAQI
jgi:hypothetical protein